MRFSLIVPTLNRVKELERLFQSLASQDYPNFEVILVDQNLDNLILPTSYKMLQKSRKIYQKLSQIIYH